MSQLLIHMLRKAQVFGNSFIGVFASANDSMSVLPPSPDCDELARDIHKILGLENVVRTTIDGSHIVGALLVMNSNGALVSPFLQESERKMIAKHVPVTVLPEKLNAAGNDILANDYGALVHSGFSDKAIERISKALGVPARRGRIAGYKTVGSAAAATNKAAICHPHASEYEMGLIEEALQVDVSICTANYGAGLLGACMVANTKGAVVGESSTPIELGKIEDGLKLY